MNQEIVHKHKISGITECGKDVSEIKPNEIIVMTGLNNCVTCLKCKEILNKTSNNLQIA